MRKHANMNMLSFIMDGVVRLIYITEGLLYVCFALFTGHLVMEWIPADKRPIAFLPARWLYVLLTGVMALSLIPLIDNTLFFAEQLDMGFMMTFGQMLQKMEIGKGWLITVALVAAQMTLLFFKKHVHRIEYLVISTALLLGLSFSFSWSSHVSYIKQTPGFLAHSLHFLSIMVWVGGLLTVGCFGRRDADWKGFLRWFTPLSLTCLLLSSISGLIVMNLLVSDVVTSWVFSYGQALLWKHIFVLLLIATAFINGVLIRNRLLREPLYDPLPWFRLEGVTGLTIFVATAIMGQQEPPHDVALSLESLDPSPLFLWLYPEGADTKLQLQFTATSWGFAALAVVLLLAMIVMFIRRLPVTYAAAAGLLFAISAYAAIMRSLVQ